MDLIFKYEIQLSKNGIDFIYAQTNDAFSEIETFNVKTQKKEIIGSKNERFFYTEEDIFAYFNYYSSVWFKYILLTSSFVLPIKSLIR